MVNYVRRLQRLEFDLQCKITKTTQKLNLKNRVNDRVHNSIAVYIYIYKTSEHK